MAHTPCTALLAAAMASVIACPPTWAAAPASSSATPPMAVHSPGAVATPASPEAAMTDLAAVLADLQAGHLQAAEATLRGWSATTPTGTLAVSPDDAARRQRLLALVKQQRQMAGRLLARAEADLQQHHLPQAVERYEAALALDDSLAQQSKAAALQAARSRLWQARDAVVRCMQPRDAACMDRAVGHARTLAQRDPALALLTLQASAWWTPGQPRQPAPVEGTSGSR